MAIVKGHARQRERDAYSSRPIISLPFSVPHHTGWVLAQAMMCLSSEF